jgi:hypothetical protein
MTDSATGALIAIDSYAVGSSIATIGVQVGFVPIPFARDFDALASFPAFAVDAVAPTLAPPTADETATGILPEYPVDGGLFPLVDTMEYRFVGDTLDLRRSAATPEPAPAPAPAPANPTRLPFGFVLAAALGFGLALLLLDEKLELLVLLVLVLLGATSTEVRLNLDSEVLVKGVSSSSSGQSPTRIKLYCG